MNADPKQSIITVEGRGRLQIEPDTAVIKCEVSALNLSYAEANQELNGRVEALGEAVTGVGLQKTELKTTDFTIGIHVENDNFAVLAKLSTHKTSDHVRRCLDY